MRLFSFILVLFIAAALGVLIRQEPGYALFAYRDWTIEMPLWLAGLLYIVLLLLGFFVLWMMLFLFSGSSRIKGWWLKRQQIRARKQLSQGLLELMEGRYNKAEQYLSSSARYSDVPLIHYLSAAKAAEEMGAGDRRDRYLELAHDVSGGSDVAVRLTDAKLRFEHGDLEHSVATLQHLHAEKPKHPEVLRLLCSLYMAMKDWHSLFSLLPEIRKRNIFPNENALSELECNVYKALLPNFAPNDKKFLMQFWRAAPYSVQHNPECIALYCRGLLQRKAISEAEDVLRTYLKHHWDSNIILLYGKIKGPSPHKQLNFAESLLHDHKDDPDLYLTLGRLCMMQSLWGKARDYLEESLALNPLPETYAELGQLMEQMGQKEKGQEYYKKGLMLNVSNESNISNVSLLPAKDEGR